MSALALNCRSLEKDDSPAENLTVKCAKCDPDNPRSVPRSKCPVCHGSGRARVGLSGVVREIRESRMELLLGDKNRRRSQSDSDSDY
jgi:Zn finger protein HypA/HybF involved in hydrogenase expression